MTWTEDTIEETLLLDAPIERVWEALTQPEQMRQWYDSANGVEGKVALGEEVVFVWEEGRGRIRIVEMDPLKCFAYRWIPAENHDGPVLDEGSSLVSFTLETLGEKTKLTLIESGLSRLNPGLAQRAKFMNSWGWDQCMNGLRALLAKPDDLADEMHFQCSIEAPLDRVWRLLSSAEGFREGMGFRNFEGEISPNSECFFSFGDERMRIRFESVVPMQTISYRWTPGECSDAPITEDATTLVTIQLIGYEGKTLLLLREEGFRKFLHKDGPHRFSMNQEGWGVEVLPEFKKYAEAI